MPPRSSLAPALTFGPTEEWRSVPGYEGIYEVSSAGRIRGIRRRGSKGGVLDPYRRKDGYCAVNLKANGKTRSVTLHSLIALVFLGPRPEGLEVRHLDGDPTNSTVANLCYGSRSENMNDAVAHGKHANASKITCPEGHEYDVFVVGGRRHRRCRRCRRDRYHAAKG